MFLRKIFIRVSIVACFSFSLVHSSASLITLDDLNDNGGEIKKKLKTYVGITAVSHLDQDSPARGSCGTGYTGFANFFMVANSEDIDQILWFGVSRFKPLEENVWSNNNFSSPSCVEFSLEIDPSTYLEIYGEQFSAFKLQTKTDGRQFFSVANKLGKEKLKTYIKRIIFRWELSDNKHNLNLNSWLSGINIQNNTRSFNHTTLLDVLSNVLDTTSFNDHFPPYILSGNAWRQDAINCASHSIRVLDKIGIDIFRNSKFITSHLEYQYEKEPLSSYLGYLIKGPKRARPEYFIKEICELYVTTPKELYDAHLQEIDLKVGDDVDFGNPEVIQVFFKDAFS